MVGAADFHDPLQCVNQLRQFLAADKLSIGFFLGAGCATAVRTEQGGNLQPLIPDINGLTDAVASHASGSVKCGKAFAHLINTFQEDGESSPNIEAMLNRVRALRDVAGSTAVRGMTFNDLDSLDRVLCRSIADIVARDLPNDMTPYHALARFVGAHRYPFSELFTTNYDLLMEQALEANRVAYFDGFIGASRPFFDQRAIEEDLLPRRWARLWKLHGSINWRFNKKSKAIFRSREKSDDDIELLIHPSHRKYDESRRMPYFVMMDRLRNFLSKEQKPVALVILGYSFSDEHINEIIVEGLKTNPSAAAFALHRGNLAKYGTVASLAAGNANLSVYARDGAIVRRRKANWMARPTTDVASLKGLLQLKGADSNTEVKGSMSGEPPETPQSCELLIGDFQYFGALLDSVFGTASMGDSGPSK